MRLRSRRGEERCIATLLAGLPGQEPEIRAAPPQMRIRHMDRERMRRLLQDADTTDWDPIWEVWWSRELRPLEEEAIPLIREQYAATRHWQARAAQLHYVTGFAPHSSDAREFAVEALQDRSLEVRYRACVLLAYSRHEPAIVDLRSATGATPAEFTEAAITAIQSGALDAMTARDSPRRSAYYLPIPLPRRLLCPRFAEEFHALSQGWLRQLGFAPQYVFQHDAFYRRGEVWFHAHWEQWDLLWLFMLGPRVALGEAASYVWGGIAQPHQGGSLAEASQELQRELQRRVGT